MTYIFKLKERKGKEHVVLIVKMSKQLIILKLMGISYKY